MALNEKHKVCNATAKRGNNKRTTTIKEANNFIISSKFQKESKTNKSTTVDRNLPILNTLTQYKYRILNPNIEYSSIVCKNYRYKKRTQD